MPSQRISILGCGWLGLPVAQAFIAQDYQVKGSTTSVDKIQFLSSKGVDPFLMRCNPEALGDTGVFFSSDVLFLNIPFKRGFLDPEYYFQQIASVLKHAEQAGIKNIVFASSTSYYADDAGEATEDTPHDSANPRSNVLHRCEQLLLTRAQIKATVLRFAGLYGAERKIGNFTRHGTGVSRPNAPVNLVHLDDCVDVIIKIVQNGIWGEIFNVCSDAHPLREDLYAPAAKRLQLAPPVFDVPAVGKGKIVINRKLKRRLSYTFKHPNPINDI